MAKRNANVKFMAKGEWPTRLTEIDRIIARLAASTQKPANPRHGVTGANHGWPMTLQDHLDFRVLHAWSDGYVEKNAAMMAISMAIDGGSASRVTFEANYAAYLAECRLDSKRFKFAVPFFAAPASGCESPVSSTVLGAKIKIERTEQLMKQFGKRKFKDMLGPSQIGSDAVVPEWFLTCLTSGHHSVEACNAVEPAFDAFRGAIELYLGQLRMPRTWPYRPPRAVRHPGWGVAYDRDEKELHPIVFPGIPVFRKSDGSRAHKPPSISFDDLSDIQHNLRGLKKGPSESNDDSAQTIVADALRIYCSALDASTESDCFLGFWRCAERIVAASNGASNKEVIARLTATATVLNKFDGTGINSVLKQFAKTRNGIVHHGIGYASQEEAAFLKIFVEVALILSLENLDILKTHADMRYFYQTLTANEKSMRYDQEHQLRAAAIRKRVSQSYRKANS